MHALWTNGTHPNGQRMHYAMGFVVDMIGEHREIWHNGYSPKAGGYCLNAIFPEDDLAVVILSNSPDSPFRGQPEKIVKSVLALYDPRVAEQKEAAPANVAQDDPAVNALTMKLWDQMSSSKPDRSLLSPEMNAAMTPELLASAAPQLQALGKLVNLSLLEKTAINGGTNYVYAARFSSGTHKINIFMTADDKVGGYRVLP